MTVLDVKTSEFESAIQEGVVLVDFWAPWCGPCKMIAPVLEELDVNYAGKVKIVKVNIDEEGEIAERYEVMSIPTLLVIKEGVVVEQVVGFRPVGALEDLINNYL